MDFNNSGAMRSPFSPRVRQSIAGRRPIGLSSAKKNQSQFMQSAGEPSGDVIYKTPMSTVETYGQPLPVMVTETLAFASGEVSVRVSPCGWCWVVSGRRVVAWPLVAQPSHAPAHTLAARELTLPQTDLAHKADLVVLFYEDGAQMPSCIGVSPEGVVRYWVCVGQEGVFSDASAELAGQECDRLAEPSPLGLLLATTTCTAVLLTPAQVDGRATVVCRTLRPPSGWLGGIGRRVSLLFFGSMPAHADTKLVGAVVLPGAGGGAEGEGGEGGEGSACVALVAGGPVLQTWRGPQLHLHEHSLRRTLTDAHARAHLAPHGDLNSLEIMGLDVRAHGHSGLLLLLAAVNVARSPDMRYAIAHISLEHASAPRVTSLVPLRSWPDAQEAPRFLPLGHRALIYTTNYIALVSMTVSNDKVDYIDVSADGDKILGAELCNGVPLLFSRKHGVLALSISDTLAPTPSLCDSPLGSPCPSDMYDGNLSLYEIDPHEVSMVTTDACGKLKTAFLFHVRRDSVACRAILDELFPPPRPPPPPHHDDVDVDSVLDRTVLKIATEMLDDIPAGDPRWRQPPGGPHTYIALGRSAALQLAAQLRDKQRAFSLFVDFLRATGLWQRLGLVTKESGDGCVASEYLLGALAECLAAALALRRLQQGPHAPIIDAAVYQVVCGENPEVEEEPEVEEALSAGGLAPSDVCFRRVSRIRRVLRALALSQPNTAPHATHTIHILTSALTEMHKCRAQWQSAAPPAAPGAAPPAPPGPPPPPLGPRALLPALAELHKRAVTECAHKCEDANLRSQVLEAAGRLADLLLTEAQRLQHSAHTAHIYERMRRETIQPYMEEGQTERAAALAEKFKDFDLLIEMCVNNDDLDRLYTYIDNYSNEGMSSATFAWLAARGGAHVRTLVQRVGGHAGVGARLAAWLAAAPQRASLLALQRLAAVQPDHAAAAHVLAHLAEEETHSLGRMMTTASLAKLCLVASEDYDSRPSDTWRKIEGRLALGEQHEALPRDIKLHNGLDTEDTRVMRPEDLVQMYVESESKSLTEYDYKKALDLTDYIHDMELRDDLRLKVWCACIKRDDWSACRVDAPADEMQNKMFFRLIDLVHVMGGDLELVLPPVEDILTARELVDLVSDPRFHFIIKYGYECLDNTRNDSMEQ